MLKYRYAAVLMAIALPNIAAGQTTRTVEADPARMCTANGAFGERFGATEVQGGLVARSRFSIYFLPRTGYPPFGASHEPLAAVVGETNHKIFRVSASAFYSSREASLAAWQAMGKQIEAGGWTRTSKSADTLVFAEAAKPKDGVQIELTLMGQRLFMVCTDMALLAEAGSS
jgi:hypothetical protein